MSFISLLIPAIQCPSDNIEIAKQFFASQLNIDSALIHISKAESLDNKTEFCVRILNSNLSLLNIQSILQEKENLQIKVNLLEKEIKRLTEKDSKDLKSELDSKYDKIKDLISLHLESSESFRINTERTLNKIKEEFEVINGEFDEIKKLDSQRQIIQKNEKDYSFKNSLAFGNSLTSRSKTGNNSKNMNINNKLKSSNNQSNNSPIVNNLRFSGNNSQVPQLNLKMNINLTNINNTYTMDKQVEQNSPDTTEITNEMNGPFVPKLKLNNK